MNLAAITYRLFQPSDADKLLALYRDTIRRVNSADYSPEQIAAWASNEIDPRAWAERFDLGYTFVAEASGEPIGFAELENDGHIGRVYISADQQRRGIGRALLTEIVNEAVRRKLPLLFVDVSITARPFFESQGFTVVAAQISNVRGADLPNFRMERKLR